ncbi:chemotaxis protein CheW [Stigmatella sp. ncwal1]|uniref:Chemotaxis protein CheW n=1 Tax=Stigmatella ashevillensis TaxID=2995309 RepID=A0ABT5D4K1_9BACT|nr:chemotaxis protein CheW [Stigmatella ashevillena]MDC0708058.1 chemotaxis protein CheW [Stigmatella ashevillena]
MSSSSSSSSSSATTLSQYLSFFLEDEEYALGILQVKEIIEYSAVTRIPGAPPWLRGVTNLRGSVLPVVDLAVKLGLPPGKVSRRACIVVVEGVLRGEKIVMGLLIDTIGQVLDFTPEELEPLPAFGTPIPIDFLTGMGRVGSKFVLLLDIGRILGSQELQVAEALRTTDPAFERLSKRGLP